MEHNQCHLILNLIFFKSELVYTVPAQQRSAVSAVSMFYFHVNAPMEKLTAASLARVEGITSHPQLPLHSREFIYSTLISKE